MSLAFELGGRNSRYCLLRRHLRLAGRGSRCNVADPANCQYSNVLWLSNSLYSSIALYLATEAWRGRLGAGLSSRSVVFWWSLEQTKRRLLTLVPIRPSGLNLLPQNPRLLWGFATTYTASSLSLSSSDTSCSLVQHLIFLSFCTSPCSLDGSW